MAGSSTDTRSFIRLVIASDVRLYCDGLASMLGRELGVEVAGTASDPGAALEAIERLSPDLLLIDMAMEGSNEVVRHVRSAAHCLVVALALPENESTFLSCVEAGVCAYVPREATVAELVQALWAALRGEPIIAPGLTASLLRRVSVLSTDNDEAWTECDLTPREVEIAHLLADGKSNKRIATVLGIELATVKNHVHNILQKMNLSRRGEVAQRLARHRRSVRI